MHSKDNISLIGMPGSGKTTLGELLAEELRYDFVDTDSIIEAEGRTLQQIIDAEGEGSFLMREERVLLERDSTPAPTILSPSASC